MRGGVTFDFWDCIVQDDSDEKKRAELGLPPKKIARRSLFVEEVRAHHAEVETTRAEAAYAHLTAWFNQKWKGEHVTPHIAERLREGYRFLGLAPTPGFDAMVAAYATMEVTLPPDLAPGIENALEALSEGGYKIGIVSDAIVTPGIGLRTILQQYGLMKYFHHNVFSDEWGACKPARRVFERACAGLEVAPDRLVHVGDREYNDVGGPIDFGAHAVLYTGCIDRGTTETTRADAVCRHHDDLPAIVEAILQ